MFSVSNAASIAKHFANAAESAKELIDTNPSGTFLDKDYWDAWSKNMQDSIATLEDISQETIKGDLNSVLNGDRNIEEVRSLAKNIGQDRFLPSADRPLEEAQKAPNITMNMTFNVSGITDRTDKRALAKEIAGLIQEQIRRETGTKETRGRLR